MSVRAIGICTRCGGDVVVPTFWIGLMPPRPSCTGCKARPAPDPETVIQVPVDHEEIRARRRRVIRRPTASYAIRRPTPESCS